MADKDEDASAQEATDKGDETATKEAALPEDVTAPPPPRTSALSLEMPLTFPDDSGFSASVRKVDNIAGRVEQVALVALLAIICVVGALSPILHRFAEFEIPHKTDIVHYGTFTIALFGGAYASHQAKHLSMDLITRRFSQRNQLILKIVLTLFVIFVLVLLARSGLANVDNEKLQQQPPGKLLTTVQVAYLVPAAAVAMMFHAVLHLLIDIDYLRRGVTPPERVKAH